MKKGTPWSSYCPSRVWTSFEWGDVDKRENSFCLSQYILFLFIHNLFLWSRSTSGSNSSIRNVEGTLCIHLEEALEVLKGNVVGGFLVVERPLKFHTATHLHQHQHIYIIYLHPCPQSHYSFLHNPPAFPPTSVTSWEQQGVEEGWMTRGC